jgi:hypothetical protein
MIAREPFNDSGTSHDAAHGIQEPRPQLQAGLFFVECRLCGYEPEEQVVLPGHRCPKCHSWTWRRQIRPGGWLGRLPDWPGLKLRGKVRQRTLTGEVMDPAVG